MKLQLEVGKTYWTRNKIDKVFIFESILHDDGRLRFAGRFDSMNTGEQRYLWREYGAFGDYETGFDLVEEVIMTEPRKFKAGDLVKFSNYEGRLAANREYFNLNNEGDILLVTDRGELVNREKFGCVLTLVEPVKEIEEHKVERWMNVFGYGEVCAAYISKSHTDMYGDGRIACVKLTGTYYLKDGIQVEGPE